MEVTPNPVLVALKGVAVAVAAVCIIAAYLGYINSIAAQNAINAMLVIFAINVTHQEVKRLSFGDTLPSTPLLVLKMIAVAAAIVCLAAGLLGFIAQNMVQSAINSMLVIFALNIAHQEVKKLRRV